MTRPARAYTAVMVSRYGQQYGGCQSHFLTIIRWRD